jgi:hypothetical protein
MFWPCLGPGSFLLSMIGQFMILQSLVSKQQNDLVFLKCSGAVSFQDRLFAAAQDDTDALTTSSYFRRVLISLPKKIVRADLALLLLKKRQMQVLATATGIFGSRSYLEMTASDKRRYVKCPLCSHF